MNIYRVSVELSVVIWRYDKKCCLFLVLKAALQESDVLFVKLPDCSTCSDTSQHALSHSVGHSCNIVTIFIS